VYGEADPPCKEKGRQKRWTRRHDRHPRPSAFICG
jgi:hypothetical protein